jgi:hypothetical protein
MFRDGRVHGKPVEGPANPRMKTAQLECRDSWATWSLQIIRYVREIVVGGTGPVAGVDFISQ